MKHLLAFLAAMFLLTGTAGAQLRDEGGREIRDNFEILVSIPDVAAGSLCNIGDLNNQSTYRSGVTIPNTDGQIDRGNILLTETGRGGEHNGDWVSFPVERVSGAESIGEFVAGGDGFGGAAAVTIWVGYDWHSSIDDLTLECIPPPPAPTTTTVAPPETTTIVESTTTQPPPETASTERPPPTTVPPCPSGDALACTGATSSGLLRIVGLTLAAGLTLLVMARLASA